MENRDGGVSLITATTHISRKKKQTKKKVNTQFQSVFLIGISCAARSSFSIQSQSLLCFAHNIFAAMLIPSDDQRLTRMKDGNFVFIFKLCTSVLRCHSNPQVKSTHQITFALEGQTNKRIFFCFGKRKKQQQIILKNGIEA